MVTIVKEMILILKSYNSTLTFEPFFTIPTYNYYKSKEGKKSLPERIGNKEFGVCREAERFERACRSCENKIE